MKRAATVECDHQYTHPLRPSSPFPLSLGGRSYTEGARLYDEGGSASSTRYFVEELQGESTEGDDEDAVGLAQAGGWVRGPRFGMGEQQVPVWPAPPMGFGPPRPGPVGLELESELDADRTLTAFVPDVDGEVRFAWCMRPRTP